MRRFGRLFRYLVLSVPVGSLAAFAAAAQVTTLRFDEPHDGVTWHRGDVMRARVFPSVPVPPSGSSPVLELVIGEKVVEIVGRMYQNGAQARFNYAVQSDDAGASDEVRMASVSLGGTEIDLRGFTPTTYAVDGSSRGVAPIVKSVGLASFYFVPPDGVYRPGDEIYWAVRFHKAVAVNGTPTLAQRIGEDIREASYRSDIETLPGGVIFSYTVQVGDCDMDGVGVPANAIGGGGSIREAHGSRVAVTSHPARDPARDAQADATRQVACVAVPAAPVPWLVLLASLVMSAGAHLVRQRRRA